MAHDSCSKLGRSGQFHTSVTAMNRTEIRLQSLGFLDFPGNQRKNVEKAWILLSLPHSKFQIKETDLDSLESVLEFTAYGNLSLYDTSDVPLVSVIKLFRASQLTIQYLLYVQDNLAQKAREARNRVDEKECEVLKLRDLIATLKHELSTAQRGAHYARRLLKLAQKNVLDSPCHTSNAGCVLQQKERECSAAAMEQCPVFSMSKTEKCRNSFFEDNSKSDSSGITSSSAVDQMQERMGRLESNIYRLLELNYELATEFNNIRSSSNIINRQTSALNAVKSSISCPNATVVTPKHRRLGDAVACESQKLSAIRVESLEMGDTEETTEDLEGNIDEPIHLADRGLLQSTSHRNAWKNISSLGKLCSSSAGRSCGTWEQEYKPDPDGPSHPVTMITVIPSGERVHNATGLSAVEDDDKQDQRSKLQHRTARPVADSSAMAQYFTYSESLRQRRMKALAAIARQDGSKEKIKQHMLGDDTNTVVSH